MLWLEYNEENIDTTLLEKLVWANPGCVSDWPWLCHALMHPIASLVSRIGGGGSRIFSRIQRVQGECKEKNIDATWREKRGQNTDH